VAPLLPLWVACVALVSLSLLHSLTYFVLTGVAGPSLLSRTCTKPSRVVCVCSHCAFRHVWDYLALMFWLERHARRFSATSACIFCVQHDPFCVCVYLHLAMLVLANLQRRLTHALGLAGCVEHLSRPAGASLKSSSQGQHRP
jgi:hypothetical protein